jgi:hypothetical protein
MPVDAAVIAAATATEMDVVAEVNRILAWSRENKSRVGYFAALYWHVATTLSRAVRNGSFHDAARMQHLNEVFFDRYLDAVHRFREARAPTEAWQVAFQATPDNNLIVVQHLMLGANAHINFDLAIAVAEAIPEEELRAFRPDYDKMNDLLSSLIAGMAEDISRFWPLFRWISRRTAKAEDAIVAFSLRAARAEAWRTALELSAMDPPARLAAIARRDVEVRDLARFVVAPGILLSAVLRILRLGERGTIVKIIDDLLS